MSSDLTPQNDFLYTSLPDALKELENRRSDFKFKQLVQELLGSDIPPSLQEEPRAVMVRYITSPRFEYDYFQDHVSKSGLKPLLLEYTDDKFIAKNWEKYHLARMFFARKPLSLGLAPTCVVDTICTIDFNRFQGRSLRELETTWGENFIVFHHRLLNSYLRHRDWETPEIEDFSEWFRRNSGPDLWTYYPRYLALFLLNGILFENFILDPKERFFTERVVMPAFKTIADVMGRRPLIVRLVPSEIEHESHLCYYDEKIRGMIGHGI